MVSNLELHLLCVPKSKQQKKSKKRELAVSRQINLIASISSLGTCLSLMLWYEVTCLVWSPMSLVFRTDASHAGRYSEEVLPLNSRVGTLWWKSWGNRWRVSLLCLLLIFLALPVTCVFCITHFLVCKRKEGFRYRWKLHLLFSIRFLA